MKRALLVVLALAACTVPREVKLTFGETGEGLGGFVCRDDKNVMLLDRLVTPDGGVSQACLVTDFLSLGGLPDGCRTSQLIKWCATHNCVPVAGTRRTSFIDLPTGVSTIKKADVLLLIRDKLKDLGTKHPVSSDAPPEPVMLRVIATAQPCSEVQVPASGALPVYDPLKLVGCGYSCPTLFDQVDQDVFIAFDTLENSCEHGVRTCSDNALKWAP